MKKTAFINLIENPNNINSADIIGLQKAIQEFPYFQSGQLLLTKAYHESENFNFETQLKKAAAYASDRKQLHELIFNNSQFHTGVSEESNELSNFNTSITTEVALEEKEKKEKFETESLEEEKEKVGPLFVPDFNQVAEDEQAEKKEIGEDHDVLEQQILTEAIHQSILLEVDDQIPPLEELGTVDSKNQEPTISFDQNAGHSFSEWLSHYSNEDDSEKNSSLLWDKISDESKDSFKSFKPESSLPVKQEFYSAPKMAKLSVQEDDDLVTETLAMIYAEQGYPEKAIKAFEKLQLKYPEKRVYFAGRIKEIENQINS